MRKQLFRTWKFLFRASFFACFQQVYLLVFTGILFPGHAVVVAQQVNQPDWQGTKPIGTFLADSIKVGYPVEYALSLKHPADMEIIFPDSSFDFSPFEWKEKAYFPTRTDSTGSLDSVVYTLVSFQLDSLQELRLPVFIINQQDCTAVYTQPDSVFFQSILPARPNSLQVKSNLSYLPVKTHFNYGYIIVIITGVTVTALIVYAAFGKRIQRQYKLYVISREHNNFWAAYERLTRNITTGNAVSNVENAVILWKNYMELLENKPFSTYTTKEIIEVIPNPQLAEALQHTDRIIYGQMASVESVRHTSILAYVAKRAYIAKRVYIEKQRV